MAPINPPRSPRVHITTHTPTGTAIFHTPPTPSPASFTRPAHPNSTHFCAIYTTTTTPALNTATPTAITAATTAPPRIVEPNGTRFSYVDFPPGAVGGMHRTKSVDYITLLEGELELELDSGEKRTVRRGDTVVQRGTMHRWRNLSATEWARGACVVVDAQEVETENGGRLKEDLRGLMPPKKQSKL